MSKQNKELKTVNIKKDMHNELKATAAKEGKKIQEYLQDLISKDLISRGIITEKEARRNEQ